MSNKKTVGRPKISKEEQRAFQKKIIKVARKLFFDEGFESVSMRKIAVGVGCHPMSLYQYFENKYAILQNIWEVIFDELYALCQNQVNDKDTSVQNLRSVCETFMSFWVENSNYFIVVYVSADKGSLALGEKIFVEESSIHKTLLLLTDLISGAAAEKSINPHDTEAARQILYASMLGGILCMTTIPEYPWMDKDSFIQNLMDNILTGFGYRA